MSTAQTMNMCGSSRLKRGMYAMRMLWNSTGQHNLLVMSNKWRTITNKVSGHAQLLPMLVQCMEKLSVTA